MTPNNNLSVLPWYTSIDQQNGRKWWAYGRVYPLITQADFVPPFQIIRSHDENENYNLIAFDIYKEDGTLVGHFKQAILDAGLRIEPFANLGYDVIIFPSMAPVFSNFFDGRYYAVLRDQYTTYYSDVFTVVHDMSRYLKVEWWDNTNLVMDDGIIVYRYANNTQYRNFVYLMSDLGKPEYIFEEEGETRDGYFMPIKQLSEKRYKFEFLAPEYLLDVMRLVRLSDNVAITKNGVTYLADTFLMTPEWQGDGDIASVEAEFDTNTVAKKIGLGFIKTSHGDFNNDFNNDFDID